MDLSKYSIKPQQKVNLQEIPQWEETDCTEEELKEKWIPENVEKLKDLQLRLFAEKKKGILVVLQAIDAAGKDEIITFIFSNLMPQSLKVTPTKEPSKEEQKHDFLWRIHDGLPERGQIAILNRSYYEDLIAPIIFDDEGDIPLPSSLSDSTEERWKTRSRQINDFERYLVESGFPVVKLLLHVSKEEQKKRLLERMKDPKKNWEFSFSDLEDREKWEKYQEAFEEMLSHTSTELAPWYVLPADNSWYTRFLASEIMIHVLEKLKPQFPILKGEEKEKLNKAVQKLEKNK